MAERPGFEPGVQLPVQRLSRAPPSATRSALLGGDWVFTLPPSRGMVQHGAGFGASLWVVRLGLGAFVSVAYLGLACGLGAFGVRGNGARVLTVDGWL